VIAGELASAGAVWLPVVWSCLAALPRAMASAIRQPLVAPAARVEPARFYVLALFFVLMANQCLFWFTFSADPETFKAYYPGLTTPAIDQLLNWGPITFVPTVPFVSWLLMQENGLRKCMRINACLAFVACALRYIPCLVSASFRRENQWLLLLLHAAQILNGSLLGAGAVLRSHAREQC